MYAIEPIRVNLYDNIFVLKIQIITYTHYSLYPKGQNILIITYYWPPSGGSGVQRWMYFALHLQQLGYNPVVLTVDPQSAYYAKTDKSLESLVTKIETHRVRFFNPLGWYSFFTQGDFNRGVPQGEVVQKSVFQKIAACVRANFFVPDARKGWVRPAYQKAVELIQKNPPGVIITTGPPHSTHLIGLKLKKRFNHHWLVDFRDPWSELFYLKSLPRSSYAIQKDLALESRVLATADTVLTTTTKNFHAQLAAKAPKGQRFYTLYNGFDASLFKTPIAKKQNNPFTIVFTGLLTEHQAYLEYLQALHLLYQKEPHIQLRCELVGTLTPDAVTAFQAVIPTTYRGYLDHEQAVMAMRQADLLLNFSFTQTGQTTMVSGKIFEYMATGNPILHLGDPFSEAADILALGKHNLCCAATDHQAQQAFIEKTYKAWAEGQPLKNDVTDIAKFSREATTRQLVEVLNQL
jgi:glycosyltransferase involved in cell wall biosynthesis